jgi:hypothetical protein
MRNTLQKAGKKQKEKAKGKSKSKKIIKHAHVGQLNSFTQVRALLVLTDRGILGLATSVADGQKKGFISLANKKHWTKHL